MESFKATTNTRRSCVIQENNGLASLTEINNNKNKSYPLISRPLYNHALQRRNNLVNLQGVSSSSSSRRFNGRFYFDGDHHQPHFLDACFLCKKSLCDKDIFMYRGDTPFCSEECRGEQIEMDEAKEKSWNLSAIKALRKKDQHANSTTSPTKTTPFRTGAVAAA